MSQNFYNVPLFLPQVHHILDEIVMGGMVLETSMQEILTHVDAQDKLLKAEVYDLLWSISVYSNTSPSPPIPTNRAPLFYRKLVIPKPPRKLRPWDPVFLFQNNEQPFCFFYFCFLLCLNAWLVYYYHFSLV